MFADDIYEQPVGDLQNLLWQLCEDRHTTPDELLTDYMACQGKEPGPDTLSAKSNIALSERPLPEIETTIFRRSPETFNILPRPPRCGLEIEATWRLPVGIRERGMERGPKWESLDCAPCRTINNLIEAIEKDDSVKEKSKKEGGEKTKMECPKDCT